jgi:hypothetical protein
MVSRLPAAVVVTLVVTMSAWVERRLGRSYLR